MSSCLGSHTSPCQAEAATVDDPWSYPESPFFPNRTSSFYFIWGPICNIFFFFFFNLISSSASEHPETIWGWVIVTSSWVYLGIKETQTFCRWGIGNCLSQMCLLHWPKQGSLSSPGCSIWTKPRDPQPAAHTVSAGWKQHFFGFLSSFQTERCISRNSPAWFSCKAIMYIIPTAFVSSAHCTPWQDKLINRIYFLKSLL